VVAVAAMVLSIAGCDVVRAGTKCRAGAAPGRDATHVLLCQKGKWTRSLTIQQAADIIISTWPTTVEVLSGGGQTTGIGSSFGEVSVRVSRKDGSVVKSADVVFSGPSSGASIAAPSGLVATDSNGIARFTPIANSAIGGYGVTAAVNGGYSPYVVFGLNNSSAAASSISVVSGSGQTAAAGTQFANPVVVTAVDRFGNTITNTKFQFSTAAAGVWLGPAEAYAGDDGRASTTIGTGNRAGTVTIAVQVVGADVATTFNLNVIAGAIDHSFDFFTGDDQTANPASDLQFANRVNNPLNVGMVDMFGNPVVNQPVQYAIVPIDAGSGGTFDATSTELATILSAADGIAKAQLHDNGTGGTFQVVATVDGGVIHTFTVNP